MVIIYKIKCTQIFAFNSLFLTTILALPLLTLFVWSLRNLNIIDHISQIKTLNLDSKSGPNK